MHRDGQRMLEPFRPQDEYSPEDRRRFGEQLRSLVPELRDTLQRIGQERLDRPYRPGGWTVRQVVHHMADNDMNAYLRLKRALTEAEPIASTYDQAAWAELPDSLDAPVMLSVQLLDSIHQRLVLLVEGLSEEQFRRRFSTQALGVITVDAAIHRFLWHNRHHLAQIEGGAS